MSYFLSAFENSGPRGDRERSPMPLSGVRSSRAIQTLGLSYVNNIDDTAGGSGDKVIPSEKRVGYADRQSNR